jgi:hypothetical protein
LKAHERQHLAESRRLIQLISTLTSYQQCRDHAGPEEVIKFARLRNCQLIENGGLNLGRGLGVI